MRLAITAGNYSFFLTSSHRYTISVKAECSQAEKSIELHCFVRRSAGYDIE
jgi:hypothetical protein